MKKTEKCIICLKPANHWGGHLITDSREHIIAGFCDEHIEADMPYFMKRIGCYGAFSFKYGISKFPL